MLAIVLSGGGAKGAYQAGVWKALRKLKIKYDIVTGTSIGALNGMMMVQDSYYTCMHMWKHINYNKIYKNFDSDGNVYSEYIEKVLEGGIDTTKIEALINRKFNARKLYNSKIDFGIVAYNLKTCSAVYSTKNEKPEKLKKHLLASATCFPLFKPTKFNSNLLIDGGYCDYLPINLAIELGATEVIAVDVKAPGLKKQVKDKNINITYITPKNKLDSFFKFEKKCARRMMKLGYNDTMKVFNKYSGDFYTFNKNSINIIYDMYINNIIHLKKELDCNYGVLKDIEESKGLMLKLLEDAMTIFKLPEDNVYNANTVNKHLLKKLDKVEDININEIDIETIKKLFKRDVITKYIYTKFKNHDKINYTVFGLFPKELSTAIYLLALRS